MEELKETEILYITIGTAVCPHCNMVNIYKTKKGVNPTDEKKYKTSSHCMYCGKDFLLTNVINGLIA